MRLIYVLLAAILLAGCSNDSESSNAEQDTARASGTTRKIDQGPSGSSRNDKDSKGNPPNNQGLDPLGTGPNGDMEDGARPPGK